MDVKLGKVGQIGEVWRADLNGEDGEIGKKAIELPVTVFTQLTDFT